MDVPPNDPELPAPAPNGDSRPFWDAAREGRLLIRRCLSCETAHFMPRNLCPHCWSDRLAWVESGGGGRVAAFSIVHRAPTAAFARIAPYVVALIELDEGPRLFSNILGRRSREVATGSRVTVVFEERAGGIRVPQFELAPEGR